MNVSPKYRSHIRSTIHHLDARFPSPLNTQYLADFKGNVSCRMNGITILHYCILGVIQQDNRKRHFFHKSYKFGKSNVKQFFSIRSQKGVTN
jgi:hypothetical protein